MAKFKRAAPAEPAEPESGLISTGCTLLNLACSDNIQGAFRPGRIANLVGDSSSGKSFVALTMLAECAANPFFDEYDLIYDDVERASEFDQYELFGSKFVNRVSPPDFDARGEPVQSHTIQDFFRHVLEQMADDRPTIYVLDSFDALTSDAEEKDVVKELKVASDEDDEGEKKGSYHMDIPKVASRMLRSIKGHLKRTQSFLLIVSQTRDDINPSTFTKKTRSGGRALKFYSSHEIWLAVGAKLRRGNLALGIETKVKLQKNKLTGKLRDVHFPIYYSYGIDDIGACVRYLIAEKVWKGKTKGTVEAILGRWSCVAGVPKLIKEVERQGLEPQLRSAVGAQWAEAEAKLKVDRKRRYE